MIHPLLKRQLKKVGLEADTLPANLDSWTVLLEHINRAYTQNEQDRYLLERSLSIASEEMQQEIAERKQVEEMLVAWRSEASHPDLKRWLTQSLERVAPPKQLTITVWDNPDGTQTIEEP